MNKVRITVLKTTLDKELAKEYGVCKKTIMDAVKGKSWKCVNYLPAPPDRRPPEGEDGDATRG